MNATPLGLFAPCKHHSNSLRSITECCMEGCEPYYTYCKAQCSIQNPPPQTKCLENCRIQNKMCLGTCRLQKPYIDQDNDWTQCSLLSTDRDEIMKCCRTKCNSSGEGDCNNYCILLEEIGWGGPGGPKEDQIDESPVLPPLLRGSKIYLVIIIGIIIVLGLLGLGFWSGNFN